MSFASDLSEVEAKGQKAKRFSSGVFNISASFAFCNYLDMGPWIPEESYAPCVLGSSLLTQIWNISFSYKIRLKTLNQVVTNLMVGDVSPFFLLKY